MDRSADGPRGRRRTAGFPAAIAPIGFPERPRGWPWAMPSLYLAPVVGVYVLGAGWTIRGLSLLRRAMARG